MLHINSPFLFVDDTATGIAEFINVNPAHIKLIVDELHTELFAGVMGAQTLVCIFPIIVGGVELAELLVYFTNATEVEVLDGGLLRVVYFDYSCSDHFYFFLSFFGAFRPLHCVCIIPLKWYKVKRFSNNNLHKYL